jgi:hypothetical protein
MRAARWLRGRQGPRRLIASTGTKSKHRKADKSASGRAMAIAFAADEAGATEAKGVETDVGD